MERALITVTQLNKYVKSLIDGDFNLKTVFVQGEISNLKINSFSGHIYFTLKDANANVKAVMFKSYASRLRFLLEEGMQVICNGSVTVYERDGAYQLYVSDIQPNGAGSIAIAFEQLKSKLSNEGLFDNERKRPIPKFPKKIAVITSATGAAVQDMISVIGRRWPLATLVMCPVKVQGSDASIHLVDSLNKVNSLTDCDVIIIGRGGGSTEDLWCFNDEMLARTIANSKIPVISAVGHETDFTICDFVADLRAPTPSAAAELAVPDISEISNIIKTCVHRMNNTVNSYVNILSNRLSSLIECKSLTDPFNTVNQYSLRLDNLKSRLDNKFLKSNSEYLNKLTSLTAKLDALNPAKTLLRGYSITKKDNVIVKSVNTLSKNDKIEILLSDGKANCTVDNVERNI